MATLRAVPDTARRGVGIVRVSKVGDRNLDDLISPDVQRRTIVDYAGPRGIRIVDWVEVLDESASQVRSPWWRRLDEQIARVEAGEVDVIVGWKFNRAARNRRRWAIAIDRIETAGGTLESATEGVDTTTSTGRLTRGMLAEVAAWEAEVRGEGWKEAHAARLARGLPANGKPRWGYRYVDKHHVPDPDTADVLADLYRRYVAGESIYSLVKWLNDAGHRTAPGYTKTSPGPFSDRTLRRMLDSGFAAGLLLVRGHHIQGKHDPVISPRLWAAYQAARQARRVTRSSERSVYLLSGMMRCSCGSAMSGGRFGRDRVAKFRCTAAKEQRRHTGGYVTMRVAENEVMRWLRELESDLEAAAAATVLRDRRIERRRRDATRLDKQISKLNTELVKLTRQHTASIVAEDTYIATRDEITAERDQLAAQLRQASADAQQPPTPVRQQVTDLLDQWDTLSVELRRGALRDLIRVVHVTPGRPQSRVRVVPAWKHE